MVDALNLPALIKTPTGYSFDPIEALGLTLAAFKLQEINTSSQ